MALIECVPNFSEGRDQAVIDAISDAIRATPGCTLLDVDPGKSTNRTVYTFVGAPAAVVRGAVNACKVASARIDMQQHKGEHPRFGACDVCPFIPVQNATMEDCVACANDFGKLVALELGIPVYLYGHAAKAGEHRVLLPQIRAGEYEGLADRITRPEWAPDYGPAQFVPTVRRWGATAAGARKFLIAYNVNILGTKEQAHRIALNVRDQGRGPDQPGRLKECKGIGWWVDDYNLAQVSVNLTDYVRSRHPIFTPPTLRQRQRRVRVPPGDRGGCHGARMPCRARGGTLRCRPPSSICTRGTARAHARRR